MSFQGFVTGTGMPSSLVTMETTSAIRACPPALEPAARLPAAPGLAFPGALWGSAAARGAPWPPAPCTAPSATGLQASPAAAADDEEEWLATAWMRELLAACPAEPPDAIISLITGNGHP